MDLATVVVHIRSDNCDLQVVDVLARLALEAHRGGCILELAHVAPELSELLDFLGLSAEVLGEPEQWEEARLDKGVLRRDRPL